MAAAGGQAEQPHRGFSRVAAAALGLLDQAEMAWRLHPAIPEQREQMGGVVQVLPQTIIT
jgi:hypothetical protein